MTTPDQSDSSYWALIDPAWDDLCTGLDGADAWRSAQERHPRPVVLLFAAHFCQSEVCNGGFAQFFFNSTGVLGPEAIEGFRALSMPDLGDVVADACSCLGPNYPRDRAERWQTMLSTSGKNLVNLAQSAGLSFDSLTNGDINREVHDGIWQAMEALHLRPIDDRFFSLIFSENGGFEAAADRYAKPFL